MTYSAPAKAAIDKAGGPTALARELEITKAAVSNWEDIPAKYLMRVSALVGIPPEQIRPDLMPPAKAAAE